MYHNETKQMNLLKITKKAKIGKTKTKTKASRTRSNENEMHDYQIWDDMRLAFGDAHIAIWFNYFVVDFSLFLLTFGYTNRAICARHQNQAIQVIL